MQAKLMKEIEVSIENFHKDDGYDSFIDVLESVRVAMGNDGKILVPVEVNLGTPMPIDVENVKVGDVVELKEDLSFKIRGVELAGGGSTIVAFTSKEEMEKGDPTSIIEMYFDQFLESILKNPATEGLLLNPWGKSFMLEKAHIKEIFKVHVDILSKRENIFCFVKQDITQADTMCIVNAANNSLLGGGGVDGAIHRAAGPQLLKECITLHGCETGEAKITAGYNLKAKHVIHTVGPVYSGSEEDARLLRNCYWNSLEMARANDIHSIAFPAISTGVYGYPLEEATEVALKAMSDWLKVNPYYGMAIMVACFDDHTVDVYNDCWEKYEASFNYREINHGNDGQKLEKAIKFAVDKHSGDVRKGSSKPYILHPMETLQILAAMDADMDLMIAGLLHDVLEDTDATLKEIVDEFGVDVAALVNSHTEDKRQLWYVRKLTTIQELKDADIRLKMLVMADKVANLRSMYNDYKQVGEELWDRFNAPKELQAWYYSEIQDGLEDLQNYTETRDVYWEMVDLFKDIFVVYFLEEDKGRIYQLCADGHCSMYVKEDMQYVEFWDEIPEDAEIVCRKVAERIEDNWREEVLHR